MYTKSHIVSILLLLVSVAASAQYSTGRVNHYLALSLGGGESNTFTSFAGNSSFSKDQAGGNALFNIAYELRKDQFFFGLGIGVAYNYTWQKTEPFCNTFSRTDREGDDIIYTYQYTDYCDRQHVLSVGIPVYFGGYIGSYAYILAGAKFSFPILADHYTTTMLSTNGTYTRFIHTIENAPTYGFPCRRVRLQPNIYRPCTADRSYDGSRCPPAAPQPTYRNAPWRICRVSYSDFLYP